MDFRILGPLEVAHGGAPVPIAAGKQRALLADLLLNTNRAMATRRLVDDLWGDDVPDTAVKALQVYVSKLRKALPEDRLHTRDPGYLLEIRDGELDLDAFSRLAAEGRAALADGEAERASETLEQALALWRGPALLELDAPFTRVESARLGELRQSCLEDRIDADLRIGRHIALVPELEALVASLPLRERLRSQLMLALYRSGRQAEALDVYQSFRRFLDQELGIEPTQSLRELERRLLQQDPVLDAPVGAGRGTRGSTTTVPTLVRRRAVGRATELGALRGSLDRALSGTRQVAFVTGEAGAGKTTLVELLLLVATSLGEGVLVARGQCIENRGPGEPYMPLLEAIGRLGRGDRGPVVVDCLSRFAPTWLSQLPALVPEADREWVEARSLGVTRERMLREMADALDVITAETPLVLVLEDLHWSDPSTLDLVDTIARRPDAARLFVIGTYRTGHHGSHVPELERSLRLRNLCTEVAVGPLSAASVGEYLAERLPGVELPPEFAQDVHRRTRGIPLFVERLVDSWLDGGAVERHGDEWRVVVPLEQLRGEVPETLRELIAEQVRPLTVEARELLESASAVGTEFSALPAAAGAGVEAAAAERTLASIASRQQIIEPRGVERLPDGTVTSRYAFTHDLCHEWLYGELAPGRRAAIHQRIGERLEEAYGERASEIASELAWHFREGHDAPRAVGYLLDVAEHAFRRGASREAVRQVETALALVGDVPDKTLAVSLEVSARFLHGPSRIADEGWASPVAEDSLVRAVELARGGGSVEQLGQALFKLSVLYEVRGQYTRSGGLIEEALGLPPDDLSRELRVNSHELLACSLVHQGRHEEALVEADRALELLGRDVLPEPVAIFGESPGVSGHA
ncbi:MAG TPA: BTAD domain-containing putative transcriptional regulator, partial [Gaiellaceae bacterium]|nr:BTAD domain-containing putative transcriptional regulator [Gaiellaceae bacterium]